MASNIPHLVGILVVTSRQRTPMFGATVMIVSSVPESARDSLGTSGRVVRLEPLRCRLAFLWVGERAARAKPFDLTRVETKFPKDLRVVLAKFGRPLGGDFGNAMHLHGT